MFSFIILFVAFFSENLKDFSQISRIISGKTVKKQEKLIKIKEIDVVLEIQVNCLEDFFEIVINSVFYECKPIKKDINCIIEVDSVPVLLYCLIKFSLLNFLLQFLVLDL